mmetsp:Transcript_71208/g.199727  ORF Transcript_71208/g.199727 Transcript_71208/m.199727 type:complete len:91 (-) Transcript_71208:77-349(-)
MPWPCRRPSIASPSLGDLVVCHSCPREEDAALLHAPVQLARGETTLQRVTVTVARGGASTAERVDATGLIEYLEPNEDAGATMHPDKRPA